MSEDRVVIGPYDDEIDEGRIVPKMMVKTEEVEMKAELKGQRS